MGLGLAICRMIVERHEGRLAVSSANPRGHFSDFAAANENARVIGHLGRDRTFSRQGPISTLPLKADIRQSTLVKRQKTTSTF
jgi:signal transduction histidine kinase